MPNREFRLTRDTVHKRDVGHLEMRGLPVGRQGGAEEALADLPLRVLRGRDVVYDGLDVSTGSERAADALPEHDLDGGVLGPFLASALHGGDNLLQ